MKRQVCRPGMVVACTLAAFGCEQARDERALPVRAECADRYAWETDPPPGIAGRTDSVLAAHELSCPIGPVWFLASLTGSDARVVVSALDHVQGHLEGTVVSIRFAVDGTDVVRAGPFGPESRVVLSDLHVHSEGVTMAGVVASDIPEVPPIVLFWPQDSPGEVRELGIPQVGDELLVPDHPLFFPWLQGFGTDSLLLWICLADRPDVDPTYHKEFAVTCPAWRIDHGELVLTPRRQHRVALGDPGSFEFTWREP